MNFPAINSPEFLQIPVIISIIILTSNPTKSQSLSSSQTDDHNPNLNPPDSATNFQPSLAVVIGVLAIMFSCTFLLLIYAKCCHRPSSPHYLNQENLGGLSLSRLGSGIDKTVIESLPFFRFSTLKGLRNGLECSICLSRFEDVEILRLLPKCKHGFHIDCVDQWLEKHSGCPLCRCKVDKDDVKVFQESSSFRVLKGLSQEGSSLELFVEREGSARFGSQRSVQKMQILEDEETLHKFHHRIIVSDYDYEHGFMGKNRWSSLSSSDLMFLKSQMITDVDHDHVIKIKEEIKNKREFERKVKKFSGGGESETGISSSNELIPGKGVEKRSMSEIVVHPRFLGVEGSNYDGDLGGISGKEERLKRLWQPIARRTIQMYANKDDDQLSQINTRSQV